MSKFIQHPASFKDPSGYIFTDNKEIFRTVDFSFKDSFEYFVSSGLCKKLINSGFLLNHSELKTAKRKFGNTVYKVLKPDIVPFISYPYEWSFDMLHQAARLTLKIAKTALNFGMTLKDASAFNVQFIGSSAVFIDTLSFEKLENGSPWLAYRQFCQHFLAPLALMKFKNLELGKFSQFNLDGIKLNLAVNLLPIRCFLNPYLFIHLFLHNLSQNFFQNTPRNVSKLKTNLKSIYNLINSLNICLDYLEIKNKKSFWSRYYQDFNYSQKALQSKAKTISSVITKLKPRLLADFGSNTGFFSRIAAENAGYILSIDNDPVSVNDNFRQAQKAKIKNILPLYVDLVNPTPGVGWQNSERASLLNRFKADCVLALALIHHLYFSDNLSFDAIAGFFGRLTKFLIIEFVPENDEQINKIIGLKKITSTGYNEKNFLSCFSNFFKISARFPINDSGRILYLMERKYA